MEKSNVTNVTMCLIAYSFFPYFELQNAAKIYTMCNVEVMYFEINEIMWHLLWYSFIL